MTTFPIASAEAGIPKTAPSPAVRPILIVGACTLSALLAMSSALAGASSQSSLLMLAAAPSAGLLVFGLSKAASFAGRLDVFSPLVAFPVLYVAWFAVGSIDLINAPASFSGGLFEPIPGYVIGYAALGLTAYLVGAARRRRKPIDSGEEPALGFAWREQRFFAVTAGLGALMLVCYVYIISGMGGIPALSADAGEIRLRIARFGPAEAVMLTSAWTLIPTLMMYVWRRSPQPGIRLLCFASVGATSVLLLSLGGRSYLFVPLLTTLVARHYGKQRFVLSRLALLGAALFCALSLFGYVRDTAMDGTNFGEDRLGVPGAVVPLVYAYLYVRYPVATFRDITSVIPGQIPFQYGALTFGPLATVLPGHHEPSDKFFKDMLGSDFLGAGQPATLLGPLYGDAGLFGILAGLFLAGMLVSGAYGWMRAEPTEIRVLLYAWLMQTLLFSLFADLLPFITTVWIPAFWMALHLILRPPGVAPESASGLACQPARRSLTGTQERERTS